MRVIKYKDKIIKLYDSIDELPIVNFQKYNKYLLIDSGIGSDLNAFDEHISKIAMSIKSGDPKKALIELQNLRQNLYMVNSEISPKYLAFAALVHSVNGKPNTDMSDDNLKKLLEFINVVPHSVIIDFLAQIKKKVATELEVYFPNDFVTTKEKEAYDKLKSKVLLELDSVVNGTDNSAKLEDIENAAFQGYQPKIFSGSDSVEIKYDKQFENTCLLIKQKIGADAKQMTVLEFYNAVDLIKGQSEQELKSLKRPHHER